MQTVPFLILASRLRVRPVHDTLTISSKDSRLYQLIQELYSDILPPVEQLVKEHQLLSPPLAPTRHWSPDWFPFVEHGFMHIVHLTDWRCAPYLEAGVTCSCSIQADEASQVLLHLRREMVMLGITHNMVVQDCLTGETVMQTYRDMEE